MRCCPTRSSAATTIASARSTARRPFGARRHHRRDRLLRRALRRSVRAGAAAMTVGRDLRYTLELDFEEAALGCEKVDRVRAPGGLRGLPRHGRRGRQRRPHHLHALRRRGRDSQEGGLPVQPARLHGLRRHGPGAARALPELRGGRAGRSRAALHACASRPARPAGSTQRVPREGGPGRRGGPPGDLHVIVRVRPHPFFIRERRARATC